MREQDVILTLANHGDHIRRYEIMLPNVFVQHDSEADLFCVRKSGLCDEFEVKTSRPDFLNDKNKFVQYRAQTPDEWGKFDWHNRAAAPNYKTKYEALVDGDMDINYFWFAVLEGVADVEEAPDFAGFIVIDKDGFMRIKRQPKRLHSVKMSLESRYKLARKATYRFWKLKNELAAPLTT